MTSTLAQLWTLIAREGESEECLECSYYREYTDWHPYGSTVEPSYSWSCEVARAAWCPRLEDADNDKH